MAIVTQQVGKVVGGGGAPLGAEIAYQVEQVLFGELAYYYVGQFDTYGAVQFVGGVTLPRNALVDKFDVLVTAARATAAHANEVAQVRANASSNIAIGDKGLSVVVDFGTPRTVNAISVTSPYKIAIVKIWNGAQFVDPALYHATLASKASPPYDLIVTPSNPASLIVSSFLSSDHSASLEGCWTSVHRLAM